MCGTGIESVTACQTARMLAFNLLSPNVCGALDTVRGRPSGGCSDSSSEREFPSHKVYRGDDRGIVGVESFGPHGFRFFAFHACLDMTRLPRVPNEDSPHRLRCASNSTCLARSWVARYTRADGPSGQRWPPAASGHGCGVAADSNFATLMSSPSRVGRCVGWKVFHKWARRRWPDCLPQLALWHCR